MEVAAVGNGMDTKGQATSRSIGESTISASDTTTGLKGSAVLTVRADW